MGLVERLCKEGPLSVSRLQKGSRVTRQAVAKHLAALAHAGLARDTRLGRERIWSLEKERLARARQCLDEISAHWDDAIGRLKAFVEHND